VSPGEYLTIIQHPSGGDKQIALRENQLLKIDTHTLWYRTDTSPGSSGSPVFNDVWQVVALHHSGVPKKMPMATI
jgi:endonuclease G